MEQNNQIVNNTEDQTSKESKVFAIAKDLNVSIKNRNTLSWWDDIYLESKNKTFKIIGCSLPVNKNYELTQLIHSFHAFVDYHNMLVTTCNNKPLSMAYLKIVDFKDILLDAEKLEKDIGVFKLKIQLLELHLKEEILTYIQDGSIAIEEKTATKTFFKTLGNIFRWKKHDSSTAAVQVAVTNNLVNY